VAAFAAGAEAHLPGKLAVCAGSCGPGNLHLNQWPVRLSPEPRSTSCPSQLRFRVTKSGADIFRRPIRSICSANAAITANWSHNLSRCPAY
jgi:hypothetical protein